MFLKPGHHTFLIYDPVNKRAFCQDFIVKLNTLEFFPEYPNMTNNLKPAKPKQNVWRQWVENTDDTLE